MCAHTRAHRKRERIVAHTPRLRTIPPTHPNPPSAPTQTHEINSRFRCAERNQPAARKFCAALSSQQNIRCAAYNTCFSRNGNFRYIICDMTWPSPTPPPSLVGTRAKLLRFIEFLELSGRMLARGYIKTIAFRTIYKCAHVCLTPAV